MNHLAWLASLAGLISTAVVFGADMFFLTVGRSALRLASPSSTTEVMGFIHLFGDRRMPIWGIAALLSNLLLLCIGKSGYGVFYLLSLCMLILFVFIYGRFSKPINRRLTAAAKTREPLDNAGALQHDWDRTLLMRVPLLAASMIAQCVALLSPVAERQF
jgi:Domain of unknown function (DUF1772)